MKKIITLIAIASISGAIASKACNTTTGGPCHTATSNTHDITCNVSDPFGGMIEVTSSVTDTTGDGNRVISCGTASTGLDSVTVGVTTCSYDYTTYYCPPFLGAEPDSGTKSSTVAYCGASGNACPGG